MNDVTVLTVKLRLRDKHASELNRMARAVNYVWNYCNEIQQKAAREFRKWPSNYDLINLTTGCSELLGLHAHTIQQVCTQYEISRRSNKKAWLRWRGRKSLGWVPFRPLANRKLRFEDGSFIFRGKRYETMHSRPDITENARFGAGSFNQDNFGRWYLNLTIEVNCVETGNSQPVGIDLGLKSLASLSDGSKIETPAFYRTSEGALAMAQRARKTKRAKAIQTNIANRRRDFLHKVSRAIVNKFGVIVIGDVSPSRLAHTGFGKSVNDASWYALKKMLSYKSLMNGGRCFAVSERMTTQMCSRCGAIPDSRPRGIAHLGIREWACDDCGVVHDRDHNAAKNILRVGLGTLAEGAASAEQPIIALLAGRMMFS